MCILGTYTLPILITVLGVGFYASELSTLFFRHVPTARARSALSVDGLLWLQLAINLLCFSALVLWFRAMHGVRPVVVSLNRTKPYGVFVLTMVVFGGLLVADLVTALLPSGERFVAAAFLQLFVDIFGYGFQILLFTIQPWTLSSQHPTAELTAEERRRFQAFRNPKVTSQKALDSMPYDFYSLLGAGNALLIVGATLFTIAVLYFSINVQIHQVALSPFYLSTIIESFLAIQIIQLAIHKQRALAMPTDDYTVYFWRFMTAEAIESYLHRRLHSRVDLEREEETFLRTQSCSILKILSLLELLDRYKASLNGIPLPPGAISSAFREELSEYLSQNFVGHDGETCPLEFYKYRNTAWMAEIYARYFDYRTTQKTRTYLEQLALNHHQ